MKTATAPLPPLRSVQVLDQLRERIRYLHYSLPTEQAYVHWVRAFIRFHGVRHPATGASEVEAFLSGWRTAPGFGLASSGIGGLAVLLRQSVCTDLPWLQEIGRPRPSRRLPVVLTRMKWFASSVSGRRASFVRPASVWNGHADQ